MFLFLKFGMYYFALRNFMSKIKKAYYYNIRYTQANVNPLGHGFQVSKMDLVINFKSQNKSVKK